MKKTIMINLSGCVFHIDEDAYALLDNYVTNLRHCFAKEKDGKEITNDMESRISELFTEILKEKNSEVITIEDVESVISTMGKPEELNNTTNDYDDDSQQEEPSIEVKKRLFRDGDDKILGGVCSGVAAYFDWDVTLVRIAFIVLTFFVQGFIVAYIVAWIVIPEAKTAEQKLAMRGKKVTVESIGKTVTDSYKDNTEKTSSSAPRTTAQKVGDVFVTIAGIFIKIVLFLLALCCVPIAIAFLVVFLVLIVFALGLFPLSFTGNLHNFIPIYNWDIMTVTSPILIIAMAICGILVIGIPIIALIHTIMRRYGKWMPMSVPTRVVFIITWIAALVIGITLNLTYIV